MLLYQLLDLSAYSTRQIFRASQGWAMIYLIDDERGSEMVVVQF